jgi:hypothetical protein
LTGGGRKGRTSEALQSERWESVRSKIARCRTELSERQKEEMDRVRQQEMDYSQKNRILSQYYEKYSSKCKNGDPSALSLMCVATLARADLLLQQI